MKQAPTTYLLIFLILLACIAFFLGIYEACYFSSGEVPAPGKMSPYLAGVVTSIAAVLATNLGAVLGTSKVDPKSSFRLTSTWNPMNIFTGDSPSVMQTIACYIYVLGLLIAGIFWITKGFEDDPTKIVPLIPQLTKSLVGVMIGALAVSLNVEPPKP